jgi:hypothetical protein
VHIQKRGTALLPPITTLHFFGSGPLPRCKQPQLEVIRRISARVPPWQFHVGWRGAPQPAEFTRPTVFRAYGLRSKISLSTDWWLCWIFRLIFSMRWGEVPCWGYRNSSSVGCNLVKFRYLTSLLNEVSGSISFFFFFPLLTELQFVSQLTLILKRVRSECWRWKCWKQNIGNVARHRVHNLSILKICL